MDLLIEWDDGTTNVVSSLELTLVDKPTSKNKDFKKDAKVKMLFEGKHFYGVIKATENDSSDENCDSDTPLVNLVNKNSKNTDEAESSTGSEDLPLIAIKKKIVETDASEVISKRNIMTKSYKTLNSDSDDEFSSQDDSFVDPDFVVNMCAAKKCNREGLDKCEALLCKKLLCSKHTLCRDHCKLNFMNLLDKQSRKRKRRQASRPSNLDQLQCTAHVQAHVPRTCENPNCDIEIFSTCDCLKVLLCFNHFVEDSNCNSHKDLEIPPSCNETPEQLFPVEGSPREVTLQRAKRINKFKQAKKLRNTGQCYIRPYTMNPVPPKALGVRCNGETCIKLGKKCNLFNDEERQLIFNAYYNMGSLQLQREYLTRNIKREKTKQKTTGNDQSRRSHSNYYFLPLKSEQIPVCKMFFMNTLAVTDKTIRTTLSKISETGVVQKEQRGGRYKAVQIRDAMMTDGISLHINKFPRVESHYCRKSTSREYLTEDLNLLKMFSMYLADESVPEPKGGYDLYRKTFKSMNLSFHRPKKDQCTLCMTFQKGNESTKQKMSAEYEAHVKRKTTVRKHKEANKLKAIEEDSKFACAVFDLQQVFSFPITKESAVFYKRRLSVYNFTVYNIATKDCYCYTWHEGLSKRGSSEVATCVYLFLMDLEIKQNIECVQLYADGCAGQNKNSIVASMLLYCVNNTSLQEITLSFFEPLHGQSEGDSAHSAIGTAVKSAGDLFVPSQLTSVIRLARRKHPYHVIEMNTDDFIDFKSLSTDLRILSVRTCDNTNANIKIDWTTMSELKVIKSKPRTIYFKTSPLQETHQSITLKRHVKTADAQGDPLKRKHLEKLNKAHPKITHQKYKDLLSLCSGNRPVIRGEDHKRFYINLPHDSNE